MSGKIIFEHLWMVFLAVAATIAVGVPLGVCAYFFRPAQRIILRIVEILQTIPALALLGIIMVFLGAGKATVITGLVLYSLLPVVQNTWLGLAQVSPSVKEAARGCGMTKLYRLLHVELPIAFPFLFTGIRIATVTSVGIAVFAAFVGGGGLGSAIYRGIRVGNMGLILSSTLALMAMAVLFDTGMAWIEKKIRGRFSPPPTH